MSLPPCFLLGVRWLTVFFFFFLISQPFISLDNTELYFYFLVKTRSTAVTDFIFPLRTYKKTEVLNDPHLV